MNRSCSVNAYCKDKQGHIVESNLWKDCISAAKNNRLKAQQWYAVGTSSEFLNRHKRNLEVDENNQITFNCLRKLAKLSITDKEIVKKANQEFEHSGLTFNEAIASINDFNKKSQYRKECLAILTHDGNGKYTVSVVERNAANTQLLKDILKQKKLQDFLIKRLSEYGCNVEFLETDEYRGIYDTTDIESMCKSAYTLIKIAKNQSIEEQNKALAKEIGHFVIGVMGKNAFIERFKKVLTPNVVKAYIKKYESDGVYISNAPIDMQRELMGHLIGEYILNREVGQNMAQDSVIKNLLSRIKGYIMKLFKKVRDEGDLIVGLSKINDVIRDAADGFIEGTGSYDLEKAIKNGNIVKETLYSSETSTIKKKLQQTVELRQRLIDELSRKNSTLESTDKTLRNRVNLYGIQKDLDTIVEKFMNHEGLSEEDLIAFQDAILSLEKTLTEEISNINQTLSQISQYSDFTMRNEAMKYSHTLYKLGALISADLNCCKLLNDIIYNDNFNKLIYKDISVTTKDSDLDVFTTNSQSSTNVDLTTYDNKDAVFDSINNNDALFRNPDGTINRTDGYYGDKNSNRWVRFHRLLSVDKTGHNVASNQSLNAEISDDGIKAGEKGSRTDAFLRVFFNSKGTDFDGAVKAANDVEVELNGVAPTLFDINNEEDYKYLTTLAANATSLMQYWANNGIKWKTENLVVNTQINNIRIAGELDLLLKYPDGRLFVWDFKTTDKLDKEPSSPMRNVNYETQLNFYAKALRDKGYNAEVGGIIQIKPSNTPSGNCIKLKMRFAKRLRDLRVKPFGEEEREFLLSIERQYNQEKENNANTISSDTDIPERVLPTEFQKSEKHIRLYIEKYYPQYAKAAAAWFSNYVDSYGDNAYQVLIYLGIVPTTNDEIKRFKQVESKNGTMIMQNGIQHIMSTLTTLSNQWQKQCNRLCSVWLQDMLGEEYVKTQAAGIYRKNGEWEVQDDDVYITPEEALNSIDSDISVLEFLFKSAGRTHHIPSQVITKMVDATTMKADQSAFEVWTELNKLKKEYSESILKIPKFRKNRNFILQLYERDENGKFTGYYISKIKYGLYNKDCEDFKIECKKEFNAYIKDQEAKYGAYWDSLNDYEKALRWEAWFRPKYKEFHFGNRKKGIKGHSIKTKSGEIIPNVGYVDKNHVQRYYNHNYDKLLPEQKELLDKILAIKKKCDSCLGNSNVTELHRAPQIYGKYIDRITAKSGHNLFNDNIVINTIKKLFNIIFEDNDEIEIGNNLSDVRRTDWYGETYFQPSKHKSQVPMFFIKFLQHQDRMSTDIFGSMAAYASMAFTYQGLTNISSMLELMNHQIGRSKIKDKRKIDKIFNTLDKNSTLDYLDESITQPSNISRGMRAYLESNLYCRKPIGIPNRNKYLLRKIALMLSKMMTFRFLGGNLHGATVNLGTGINEIWKEAIIGEDLDWGATVKAHGQFIKYLGPSLFGSWKQIQTNKESAWFRYFNSRGDNAYQDKNRSAYRLLPYSISDLIMAPYTLGDYYMQGLSYLSVANSIKVIGEDGKTYSYFNIYNSDKGVLKLKDDQKYFILNPEKNIGKDIASDYDELLLILEEYTNKQKDNGGHDYDIVFTSADDWKRDLLHKYGIDVTPSDKSGNIIQKLKSLLDNCIVNENTELEYMRKCRAVNDRMHGIYNKANKPALDDSVFGSMMLAMRGYMLGYLERDLSASRYDITLKRGAEGTYRSVVNYVGFSYHDGGLTHLLTALLSMSIGSFIATTPILNRITQAIAGKSLYNTMMLNHTQLGEFQINNFKRISAKLWQIIVLQMLASMCLTLGKAPDDDDDDETEQDRGLNGWLIAYYILSRTKLEQASASMLAGLFSDFESGYQTGWVQEINRNSALVPQQILSLYLWYNDLQMLAGLSVDYKDPASYEGPIRDDYPEGKEGTEEYKEALKEWDKENNNFYKKTHYSRNTNVEWLLDEDGNEVLDAEGNKVPKYDTPFQRALHNNKMEGDAKYWSKLISIIPYLKSYRVFYDPVQSLDNYMFGQQMNK